MVDEGSGIPEIDVTVDHLAPENEFFAQMKAVCRDLLLGWSDLEGAAIEVTVISGGISNALYKLQPPAPLLPVAFRVYGIGTEKFVDRAKEVSTMQRLHRNNFGPSLLGQFTNGRIESFLQMRCLSPEEMANPKIVPAIAATLARFHAVDAAHRPDTAATPFTRIKEWLKIAKDLDFSSDPEKLAAFQQFDFEELTKEVEEVESAARALNSPIVFAHNDLLSGNIMISTNPNPNPTTTEKFSINHNKVTGDTTTLPINSTTEGTTTDPTDLSSTDKTSTEDLTSTITPTDYYNNKSPLMTFIDFEYADWAPRGFDLGNHFCEYAGFECDYGRYPDYASASRFLRAYLAAARGVPQEDVPEIEMSAAVADANVHALAAHQYWGTWAIMQACWSSIDFDYMGYAALRWGEYKRRKDEFIAQAKEAAPA